MTTESQKDMNKMTMEVSLKETLLKFKEWYGYILSKWLVILTFGIIGGALGGFYAFSKKPIYTATTSFVLEDENSSRGGLASLAGLASMAGLDLGGSAGGVFQGDNILELYKSRAMIEKALFTPLEDDRGKLLIDRYIIFNKLRDRWQKKEQLKNLKFSIGDLDARNSKLIPRLERNRLKDSVISEIVADINKNYLVVAKPDKKLSIIKVDVKSTDEIFSKDFNNQIVNTVNEFYRDTKIKKSKENVSILQEKTDSVRAVMNGAIFSAATIADATPNLNPTRQVQRIAPVQKSQFSAETNKAILSTLVQNLEMAKVSLRKETPLLQIVDEPVYPLKKEGFGKIKGVIIGGFLFGFFTIGFLLTRRVFRNL